MVFTESDPSTYLSTLTDSMPLRASARRTALAKRALGRSELRKLTDWNDGRPGTELNFKFYRQATNKIAGISEQAAAFLNRFF